MTVLKLVLAAASLVTASNAVGATPAPSTRVAVQDIDLATPQGRATRDLRIARAAALLCNTADPRYGGSVRRSQRACREAAIASVAAPARLAQR